MPYRELWADDFSTLRCRMCGRVFKSPNPTLHTGRGVRRWAVGFSQHSARKGLVRALRARHRKACSDIGPVLPLNWPYRLP